MKLGRKYVATHCQILCLRHNDTKKEVIKVAEEIVLRILELKPSIKECATSSEKIFAKLVPVIFWGFMVLGVILPAIASR